MFKQVITAFIVAFLLFAATYTPDADARRSSFRSSSFSKSKSFSFKKSSRARTQKSTKRKSYIASKRSATKRTKVKKKSSSVSSRSKNKSNSSLKNKQRASKSRASFKKKPKASTPRKTYSSSSNSIVSRTSNYNRRTYDSRRSNYYNNYRTPSYAYNSYSSFGMWDGLALWYMMDHMHEARYRNMYYHQMNTPGMQQWRNEANKLSADNAKMKEKLRSMDAQINTLTKSGVKRDPNFVPEGVDLDILMSANVLDDIKPVLNLCTGPKSKNYFHVGNIIAKDLKSTKVNVIQTQGSRENLINMENGKCDASIVQHDAYLSHVDLNPLSKLAFTLVASPYAEVAHMVCTESSDIESISDLSAKNTIAIGTKGSGSAVTWANIVAENEKYSQVKTQSVNDNVAAMSLISGSIDCLLSVSGVGNDFMNSINTVNTVRFNLIDFDDPTIFTATGPAGENVYASHVLESAYPNLQTDNFFNFFDTENVVLTVKADIIVNNSWSKANTSSFDGFVEETFKKLNTIRQYVGAK